MCNIWASTRENLSSGVCEQHRRRPACASAQSDQRLCYSLFGKYHMFTYYRWNFNILASLCSWGDWFETRFVGNPENRFCRVEAHIIQRQRKCCINVLKVIINSFPPSVFCWLLLKTVWTKIRPEKIMSLIWNQTVPQPDGIPERFFFQSWFWKIICRRVKILKNCH